VQARAVPDLDGRDGASLADLGGLDLSALEERLDEGAGGRVAVRVDEGEDLESVPGGGFHDGHVREQLSEKGDFVTHSFSFGLRLGPREFVGRDYVLLFNATRCQRLTGPGRLLDRWERPAGPEVMRLEVVGCTPVAYSSECGGVPMRTKDFA